MRVAVFGAGYAGLTVARRLERASEGAELVVVDESDTHLLQHELHRVVRRPSLSDAITVTLSEVLDDATVRQATVTDVDPDAGEATVVPADGEGGSGATADDTDDAGEGEPLSYDVGVVCLGSETAFFDLPGVAEHAHPLKSLDDARAIRRDALAARDGHAVVGGAGLSGIQAAGELAALSEAEGLDLDVTLVEQAETVAPGFSQGFRQALRRELAARDVTVETGVAVDAADEAAVHLDDGRDLPQDAFVWTGGIRGPAALGGERPEVGSDLRLGERTYVVGDAGSVVDEAGETVPASAQTAVRQARVAAENVRNDLGADADPEPYTDESLGWVVTVGDGAVARVGPVVLSGEPARAAKAVVGAGHLCSVGAVGEASDLVASELGWPTSDAVSGASLPVAGVSTDPGSVSAAGQSAAELGVALAEAFTPGDELDATAATRLFDRSFPGSPANLVGRGLAAPLSLFGGEDGDAEDRPERADE